MFDTRSAYNLATCSSVLQHIAKHARDKQNFVITQGYRGRRSTERAGRDYSESPENHIPSRSFKFLPADTMDGMSPDAVVNCLTAIAEGADKFNARVRFSIEDGYGKIDLL